MKFLDYQDSDATNTINASPPHYYSTSDIFKTEFMMQEFELVAAEEYMFERGAK